MTSINALSGWNDMAIPGEEFLLAPRVLAARMALLDLTVAQVVKKSGVSESTVYRAITPGMSVSYPNTMKILAALGGRAPFIFDGEAGE